MSSAKKDTFICSDLRVCACKLTHEGAFPYRRETDETDGSHARPGNVKSDPGASTRFGALI